MSLDIIPTTNYTIENIKHVNKYHKIRFNVINKKFYIRKENKINDPLYSKHIYNYRRDIYTNILKY